MKSHGSDQIELLECILLDASSKCAADPSVLRDLMTIKSRVKHEGLSFLTITLPTFGKDFEKALDQEYIDSTLFRSFGKNGSIPAFLQGMISLVFDKGTGRRLENVNISAISVVRQVAYAFKKLEIDCSPERVQSALDSFKTVERELSEASIRVCDRERFTRVADVLWNCLASVELSNTIPKHGPGATAEGIASNSKFTHLTWHERLEPYFPFLDTAYNISAYGSKEFENVTFISAEQELPVKVTPVPKTQKGPRIIAIEPVCMQYTQHALQQVIVDIVETAPLSSGHVNFTNQEINRQLAMSSSIDGSMATLDLSDASDRVIRSLALTMFDCNPDLRDAVDACRSRSAILPSGEVIPNLEKFASMGSALCFPVESMYFYTICVAALLEEQNLPVTFRNIFNASRNVYVYGDDIIVPRKQAAAIVGHLQKYYCKVNVSKSHWNGKFRESCGMDAYDGIDVTPVYIHHLNPTSRRQASELVSFVSSMNAFYKKGFMRTSSHLQLICERYLGKLPIVSETSSLLGCIHDAPLTTMRWNKGLQVSEVRGWCASPIRRTDELHGYGALMKCLLSLRKTKVLSQIKDIRHLSLPEAYTSITISDDGYITCKVRSKLTESVRRGAVTLQRHWCIAQ